MSPDPPETAVSEHDDDAPDAIQEAPDAVQEASEESFPASDAPGWTGAASI